MCVNPRNHHACRRWCAAHHHDKRRIAPTKQQKQKITNHKTKSNKPPPSYPHPKYQHHKISSKNQYSQQTPRSIQQTYSRAIVLSNEKDGPNMTTAQCNRPRRCGSLQRVRDGERTKDHELNARHPTKERNQQQYSTFVEYCCQCPQSTCM